jgi:hypothetical protein
MCHAADISPMVNVIDRASNQVIYQRNIGGVLTPTLLVTFLLMVYRTAVLPLIIFEK